MKAFAVLALLFGLGLVGIVVMHTGVGPVIEAVARVGWLGFALIIAVGFVLTVLPGLGLWALLGGAPVRVFFAARQVRDLVGDILPFTQLGGIMAGVRVLALGGISTPTASAAAIVDVTAEFISQIAYIALGLILGIAQLRASTTLAPYASGLMWGTVLLVPGAVTFVLLQRGGSFLAQKLAGLFLPAAVSHTEAFAEALSTLYQRPLRLLLSTTLHLAGWIAGGLWLWVIIRLIGAPVSIRSAIAMASLLEALRSAAVFVPSSIGVQEMGYAALAPLFGMGPEVGLAVSLIRRARDVVVGVPVLLAWQLFEGRRVLRFEQ